MIFRWFSIICLGLLISGCGKSKSSASGEPSIKPPAEAQAAPASAPAAPAAAPTPVMVVTGNDSSAVLAQLTTALRRYSMEQRKVPKTFEDFAATGTVQAPAAPAGKKFAIDPKRLEVILVNR